MPEISAKVTVTRFKYGRLAFSWEGPEDGILGVSHELLSQGYHVIRRMPWSLVEVARDQHLVYYRRREYVNGQ